MFEVPRMHDAPGRVDVPDGDRDGHRRDSLFRQRDRARVQTESEQRTDNRTFSWRVLAAGALIGVALGAVAWLALKYFARI